MGREKNSNNDTRYPKTMKTLLRRMWVDESKLTNEQWALIDKARRVGVTYHEINEKRLRQKVAELEAAIIKVRRSIRGL